MTRMDPARDEGRVKVAPHGLNGTSSSHISPSSPFLHARPGPPCAGLSLPQPSYMQAHRWGSAYTTQPVGRAFMHDPQAQLAAAGDFLTGPGAANALQSGLAAADALAGASSKL